jgi:hypothetical protein
VQFAPRRRELTLEERLAKWAAACIGGSIVMVGVLVALAFTIATRSAWVVLAVACLLVYGAQVYYLGSIGKFAPQRRLQIWLLSFLGHFLLFGAVLWVIGELSVALAVLLPEVVSGAMHLVGIHHAFRALRAA